MEEIAGGRSPATLTDIQRAARFFYLQKNSFAALVRRHNFGGSVVEPSGFNPERIPQWIENAHHRLARVRIESLPYEQILERYDRPTTLFYLDPPYYGRKLYNYNFEPEDFAKLAECLKALQGKFVLSLNDVQEVRALFRDFFIRDDRPVLHGAEAGGTPLQRSSHHELLRFLQIPSQLCSTALTACPHRV